MYGGTTKINGVLKGVDQGVRIHHNEVEYMDVSEDEETIPQAQEHPNTPQRLMPDGAQGDAHSPLTWAIYLLGVQGAINKKLAQIRQRLSAGNASLAVGIKDFSDGVKEIKKLL